MNRPRPAALAACFEAALTEALEASGWSVRSPASGADLVAERGQRRLVVELKVSAGRVPIAVLRARIADALLVARAHAERLGGEPLAIVAVEALSDRAIAHLERYVGEVAPAAAWGAIDMRGRWHWVGEGLADILPPSNIVERLASNTGAKAAARDSLAANPFSDLGQWMLKVLLMPRMPRLHLNNDEWPRPVQGVLDLARRASVAPSRASSFVAALERRGHLERAHRELRLVRVPELLDAWRHSANAVVQDVPARFALPAANPSQRLHQVLREHLSSSARVPRACLGLFSAAANHELHIVKGAPVHLYLDSRNASDFGALRLVAADDPSSAELHVRIPRFPESVFRGASLVNGVLTADLLQCWLDLASHPARGVEAAAEVFDFLELGDLE